MSLWATRFHCGDPLHGEIYPLWGQGEGNEGEAHRFHHGCSYGTVTVGSGKTMSDSVVSVPCHDQSAGSSWTPWLHLILGVFYSYRNILKIFDCNGVSAGSGVWGGPYRQRTYLYGTTGLFPSTCMWSSLSWKLTQALHQCRDSPRLELFRWDAPTRTSYAMASVA